MGTGYTREGLTAAVAASGSLSEAITRVGRSPTAGSRAYARQLIARWGIDSSHFEREGVRHTARRLREVVAESTSISDVVRRLGISPVGGNQAHIGRRIAELGIDTSHFTPYTGNRSHRAVVSPVNRLTLGSPSDGRVTGERLRKALLATGVREACALCGTGPVWCDAPLRLEVDHLNGDWWDNRPANLRLLCPNCHATTDTYRGRKRRQAVV